MSFEKSFQRSAAMLGALLLSFSLAACGPPTQQELVRKSDDVETKSELEKVLGAPDSIDKLGPVETWTYHGSDGDVQFIITGQTVALSATRDRDDEEEGEEEAAEE